MLKASQSKRAGVNLSTANEIHHASPTQRKHDRHRLQRTRHPAAP